MRYYRRRNIENKWQDQSEEIADNGMSLCSFIDAYFPKELETIWDKEVWGYVNGGEYPRWAAYIKDFFRPYNEYYLKQSKEDKKFCDDNLDDLTYLCRALSLNMFLDDNEIK